MDPAHEELLRRLAMNDEITVESVLHMDVLDPMGTGLDPRTVALVRLAALVALQSSPSSYEWSVSTALACGATVADIVGVLVAVAPVVGAPRVSGASADVATAVGLDLGLPEWE